MTEVEILADMLIGVWEYKSGEFIEFNSNGYSTGLFEQSFIIKERIFEIVISVPSIGIVNGQVIAHNYNSIQILDTTDSTYYDL